MNKKQLFLLHFAGGNCFSYNFLVPLLNDFDVYALELPGRGKRTSEVFAAHFAAAVDDYLQQIVDRLNGQAFLIYGHSMGARLGAQVVSKLEQRGLFPQRLIVSGNAGPGASEEKNRHLMDSQAFIAELKEIGGMPEDFFQHQELMDYFIPILKSDFKIIEDKTKAPLPVLKTPIVAWMGTEEKTVDKISNWANFTTANFQHKIWSGNHFFIHQHAKSMAQLISAYAR